jgi:hypothetical protein
MKPTAHTSGQTLSVGAPWEIWRTRSNITTGHAVDLYSKGGSIGLYNSLVVLIPDYQVVVSILIAGPEGSVIQAIAETVVQTFIPVLHQSAREEATKNLVGSYVANDNLNSSMMLKADDLGLIVVKWISNGSDILDLIEAYSQITNGGHVRSVRLYPTDLVDQLGEDIRVGYRILFDVATGEKTATRVFDQSLNSWSRIDQVTYGKTGVDDVVLEFDEDGNAVSIEARVLGVKLFKA